MNNKLKSMFSFCKRSGNLLSGDVQVSNALSKKKAKLVIVTDDISDNGFKTYKNKCEYYKVLFLQFGDREQINSLIGESNKAVFCIIDDNFSNKIKELIEMENII